VPLLKSLICLKGYDNGRRFLVISLICYSLVLLLSSVMSQAPVILLLLLIVTSPIIATSSMRRIHDAGFATPLAAIPLVIFWLNLFGLSYIDHPARWVLIIFAFFTTIVVGTISNANARSRRNKHYQMGYNGPIELVVKEDIILHKERIEPTIAGKKVTESYTEDLLSSQSVHPEQSYDTKIHEEALAKDQSDHWEQKLGQWLAENKKIAAIAIISLSIVTFLILSLSSNNEIEEKPIVIEEKEPEFVKQRLNKIEMPDQFWVMLDQNDALTIAWEGDFKTKSQLGENDSYWSAATGKGDKDCVDLDFALGEKLRSLNVTVKNGGDYYADFSPVDSQLIIRSIADKDRFKLCGYEFTLKGTRSLLRKNDKYFEYLKIE